MTRKLQNMNMVTKMVVKRVKKRMKRMKKRLRSERTWRDPMLLPPLATLPEAKKERKVRKEKAKARRGRRRNLG